MLGKTIILAGLLGLASLAAGQVYFSNNVTRAKAIKIASQLNIGMKEEDAIRLLATNGIKYCESVGSIGGWGRFYGLSDGTSLELDYSPKEIIPSTNGWWGDNGYFERACIQSNGVNIISIKLTSAP